MCRRVSTRFVSVLLGLNNYAESVLSLVEGRRNGKEVVEFSVGNIKIPFAECQY